MTQFRLVKRMIRATGLQAFMSAHIGAGMQNTSHYSQTLNGRVPRHGRAYCRASLVLWWHSNPSPCASLTSLSSNCVRASLSCVHCFSKVCVSLDQNWRIQWVCSGKQD